jgi:protein involved in polysaccharide export with SLBB domain
MIQRVLLLLALSACVPATVWAQDPVSPDKLELLPGDLVRVAIWREPDLSGDFLVDPTGTVVLPMIGARSVVHRPWKELHATLLEEFRYELRNPSIDLTPLRRIYVLGEVAAPGLYSVDPMVSLAGAVATAGGAAEQGDLRKIQIFREGNPILGGLTSADRLAGIGIRSGDQIFIGRRSWVARNSALLLTAGLSVTGIIVSIIARR